MAVKTFDRWEFEELNRTFGLKRIYKKFPLLTEWAEAKYPIEPDTKRLLEKLRDLLSMHAEAWNEDELKFRFIAPLVSLIEFGNEEYSVFAQRKLSAVINGIEMSGIVDFMVATGMQHPYQPFFFIHEYKQERKRDADPLGQLLAGILAANSHNHIKRTFYGAYVVGRFWFFAVFAEGRYAVSPAFDASQNDIFNIYQMLKFVKEKIEREFLPQELALEAA